MFINNEHGHKSELTVYIKSPQKHRNNLPVSFEVRLGDLTSCQPTIFWNINGNVIYIKLTYDAY